MNLKILGWIYAAFIGLVFISAEVFAFFEFEPNLPHLSEQYIHEIVNSELPPISFQEWMDKHEKPGINFLDFVIDGCDCALNPWYEPNVYSYGLNDRD